jgi:hypothetical protein
MTPAPVSRLSSGTIELADLPMFWQGRAKALRILLDRRGTPDTYTETQADTYEECAKELQTAISPQAQAGKDWRNDPSASEPWQAGYDFARLELSRDVAQAKPDPDAWMRDDGSAATINPMIAAQWKAHGGYAVPLYTSPPAPLQAGEIMISDLETAVSNRLADCTKGAELEKARAALRAALSLSSTDREGA